MSMYTSVAYEAQQYQTDLHFDGFLKTFAKTPEAAQTDLHCDEYTYRILMYMAKSWLWVQTHIEHHKRLQTKIKQPELLFKDLISRRNYDFDHPHAYLMLLMEHEENVRLRLAQFEMIDTLCQLPAGETTFPNQIVEAIMGDGKTFVSPIVAVARARALPNKLSILQLPASIFRQQQCGISQQMKKVLGFEPLVFIYSREMEVDWHATFERLDAARNNGIPLITTAETIACLHNTYLENQNNDPDLVSILELIRNESNICTDEFDSVFDKNPVVYSIGDQGSIGDLDTTTTNNLYALLRIFISTVLSHDPSLFKVKEADYCDQILPRIIEKLINKTPLNPDLFPNHSAIISNYDRRYRDRKDIERKLSDPATKPQEFEGACKETDTADEVIVTLKLTHYFIHRMFPQALAMQSGLVYGRSQTNSNSHVIVPYRNGKECLGSRYNNPYISLTLTLLQSFRDGFSEAQLYTLITLLLPDYKNIRGRRSSSKLLSVMEKVFDSKKFPEFYLGLCSIGDNSIYLKNKVTALFRVNQRPLIY